MAVAIFVIFVLSGLAGLAYELVWTRHLMLIFGVSSHAISTVLAAFMAGLALGSALLGRLADRVRHPLRLYALLEIGIGLSALALPTALGLVQDAYVSTARALPTHSWLFGGARFVLCFAILLVPTTLMGGTLPAMSREFIRRREVVGRGAGLLYGANTLGGILGAAAAGYFLLRLLGSHKTALLAVAVNLAIAMAAAVLSLRSRPLSQAMTAETPESPEPAPVPPQPRGWLPAAILVAFGLAGAASLAYEVLWTRVLVYFMDLTIYSFTTILVTFLTGIALGALLFARAADRVRNLLGLFAVMEIGIAISAAFLVQTMGNLLSVSRSVGTALLPQEFAADMIARFAAAFIVMLGPAVLMGGVFPVVTRLYTRDLSGLGRGIGDLYAANTIGCVIGSLTAGFVLLRILGAQQGVAAVAVLNGALGFALLAAAARRKAKWAIAPLAAVLALGIVLAWRTPPPVTFSPTYVYGERELLFYRHGTEASLAVLRDEFGNRELNINGVSTAFSEYGDILVHKLLAHPATLLVDEPKSALVIGFGLGATAWSFAQHPLERIDCVELVSAERESAAYFLPENGGILEDPRFSLIIQDGRNYLLTTKQAYDVISFNAIHPAYSPYLYTLEFYRLCRERLSEDGVVCAWIPTNSAHFPSLLRTFREAFPEATLWWANPGHLAMIGGRRPLAVEFADLRARTASDEMQRDLAETHLEDPTRLLSHFLMDAAAVGRFVSEHEALVNTDDLPYVGYQSRQQMKSRESAVRNARLLLKYRSSALPILSWRGLTPEELEAARRDLECHRQSERLVFDSWAALWELDVARALELTEQALAVCPQDDRAAYRRAIVYALPMWEASHDATAEEQERRLRRMRAVIAEQETRGRDEIGLPPRYFTVVRLAIARILMRQGRLAEAERVAGEILEYEPEARAAESLLAEVARARWAEGNTG